MVRIITKTVRQITRKVQQAGRTVLFAAEVGSSAPSIVVWRIAAPAAQAIATATMVSAWCSSRSFLVSFSGLLSFELKFLLQFFRVGLRDEALHGKIETKIFKCPLAGLDFFNANCQNRRLFLI